jgi:hypothetical protein
MGIIFLVVFGMSIGVTSTYFLHGAKKEEGVTGKLITYLQEKMDERAKDRA